jgi:tRNA pseudouridine55 synthase
MTDRVLLVDKPAGPTSFAVVARVRRALPRRTKVGHAGTLDPFATGLLLLVTGRATRLVPFLVGLEKRYRASVALGVRSDTGDVDGVLEPSHAPLPSEAALREALAGFVGELDQVPPAASAVKVDGRRAYALARAGEAVELAEREVEVRRFEPLWRQDDRAAFAIECSSGTYVRSLIMDLGDAYCLELRRTGIGPFDVAGADPGKVIPLNDALRFIPSVSLGAADAARAGHGVAVEGRAEGIVRLVDADGLIAIAEPRGDGLLKPVVGFRG